MRFLSFISLFLIACGSKKAPDSSVRSVEKTGEQLFVETCVMCHGEDGKKQLSGAKDLSVSLLSPELQADIITHGKGGMAGYKNRLSKREIDEIVSHIQTLKQTKP